MPFNTAEAVLACDEGIAIKIPEKSVKLQTINFSFHRLIKQTYF